MKMLKLRTTLITATLLLTWSYESWCLIKHCDPKTDQKREEMLAKKDYGKLKKYLESDGDTNGRLGTIMFANWQDQLLHIEAPKDVSSDCLWKMKTIGKDDKEAEEFNKKGFSGKNLYAGPLHKNHYVRTVSCETDACVQYYNIISRPITKPDFPVQVYVDGEIDIECSLELIKNTKIEKPPYTFVWTSPNHCPESNWDKDGSSCVQYTNKPSDSSKCETSGCTITLDGNYLKEKNYSGKNPAYKGLQIQFKGGKIGQTYTQTVSILKIKDATSEHDGRWRCIVLDANGVSSDPGREGHKLFEGQNIIHRGILQLHVKTIGFAIGVPLGIIVGVILLSVLCILLCKQCTDFDPTPEDETGVQSVKNNAVAPAKSHSGKSLAVSSSSIPVSSAASIGSNAKAGAD